MFRRMRIDLARPLVRSGNVQKFRIWMAVYVSALVVMITGAVSGRDNEQYEGACRCQ